MQTTVLFDNDGVLVDSELYFYRASREALAEIGVALSVDLYRRISLVEGRSSLDLAVEMGLDAPAIEEMRQKRNRRYEYLLATEMRICDGVEETLRALHGRARMGVVTSTPRIHFDLIHERTGLLPFFDFVLTREDYLRIKPDPDPYLTALERFVPDSSACWVIEDTERGLASARAAGLPCLVVPNDLNRDSLFPGAFRILETIRECVEIILADNQNR
ncbi:HAD family phosphatase [candidate division KSB1 bacterium]|nr:HAD family phosphatase [candidate division KSB1 bacterium]